MAWTRPLRLKNKEEHMPKHDNNGYWFSPSEITQWVMANRRGGAFVKFPEWRILYDITESIKNNTMVLSVDLEGRIHGIMFGFWYPATETFHVSQAMVMRSKKVSTAEVMSIMMVKLRKLYPSCQVTATRRQRMVSYGNIDKLITKFSNLAQLKKIHSKM